MYIESTTLEKFSDTYQEISSFSSHSCTHHSMFHSFLYENSKQNGAKTAANSEKIIDMLEKQKCLGAVVSTTSHSVTIDNVDKDLVD